MNISSTGIRLFAVCTLLSLAATCLPRFATAQITATAALLQGTVQDTSGAPIPGAAVTITNDLTKVAEKKSTDPAGRYLFNDIKRQLHHEGGELGI